MKTIALRGIIAASLAATCLAACTNLYLTGSPTTFFITSTNPGKAGDLGGLAGADAYCEKLASAAGIGGRGWRAYLSAQSIDGSRAVHARDRIGNGPWVNAKGVVIAHNVAELHGNNNINKATALTESGAVVPARPDPENKHDIMTGSQPDGTAMPSGQDASCRNWTSSTTGGAMSGHHNRTGSNPDPIANVSWNSSHISPGCDMPSLVRVGGAGLFYCFATK